MDEHIGVMRNYIPVIYLLAFRFYVISRFEQLLNIMEELKISKNNY